MTAYATNAQFLQRYDARIVGDLVSDTGNQVGAAELLDDPVLTALLASASGEIEAAILNGNRYTTTDLENLTGNSLAFLADLTCRVAYSKLWDRRPWANAERHAQAAQAADLVLERLRKGQYALNVAETLDAGLVSNPSPSRITIEGMNLVVDQARRGFYPRRRLPGEFSE